MKALLTASIRLELLRRFAANPLFRRGLMAICIYRGGGCKRSHCVRVIEQLTRGGDHESELLRKALMIELEGKA